MEEKENPYEPSQATEGKSVESSDVGCAEGCTNWCLLVFAALICFFILAFLTCMGVSG